MNEKQKDFLRRVAIWIVASLATVKIMGADWETAVRCSLMVVLVSLASFAYDHRKAKRG